MWGHVQHCRCGVCSTLKRICRHIADYSPKPGYVPFAADRLTVLAGELCDWGDSFHASGAAPPEANRPPQRVSEREVKESASGEADVERKEEDKASIAERKRHPRSRRRKSTDPIESAEETDSISQVASTPIGRSRSPARTVPSTPRKRRCVQPLPSLLALENQRSSQQVTSWRLRSPRRSAPRRRHQRKKTRRVTNGRRKNLYLLVHPVREIGKGPGEQDHGPGGGGEDESRVSVA